MFGPKAFEDGWPKIFKKVSNTGEEEPPEARTLMAKVESRSNK